MKIKSNTTTNYKSLCNFVQNVCVNCVATKARLLIICSIVSFQCFAQPGLNQNFRNGNIMQRPTTDSGFAKRNDAADSITIYYKYYNQFKTQYLDSNINNFNQKFIAPYHYQNVGNTGTATRSLLFNTTNTTGFGAGFHAFDIYNFTLENTKLYNTTKPFTELVYLLGSGAEQLIQVTHTQNKKDNVNFSLEYRFNNAPGLFKNQNSNLNNLRFTLQYTSPNKRFHLFTAMINNKSATSENGGLVDVKKLDSLSLGNPFEAATRIGPNNIIRRNPFSTVIYTGNIYIQNNFVVQSQYDIGQKDSIKVDSVYKKLFYPRFRLQHILSIKKSSFSFQDIYADSSNYKKYFGLDFKKRNQFTDTLSLNDAWSIISNEIGVISYPDKKNATQFLRTAATLENITGKLKNNNNQNLYNIFLTGEYRNRTKNKIWEIEALANIYVGGFNAGDFKAEVSLAKLIAHNSSSLQIGFKNINKTPEFLYQGSSFNIKNITGFNKENSTKIWATYQNYKNDLTINAQYFAVSNYLYFDSFFTAKQDNALINVLQVSVEKKIHLYKKINWYTSLHVQQATANAPINMPTVISFNRFVFEGTFYKNLNLATGLEVRYINNYKPNGYSPVNGQFYFQNDFTLTNKPDIHLFFNFRIKSFKTYFRIENLNTLFEGGSKQYNYSLQQYPMQNMWTRFGVWWNFVN